MKKLVNLAVMDRIDFLTRLRATGSPNSLACRLGISTSTLNEYIAYMRRTLKAPIRYNKYTQSYYYEFLPDFYLGFEKERPNPREQR